MATELKRCVTCGQPASSLVTQYGVGHFVLEICRSCNQFIDPYIEHGVPLWLIDLFLLKASIYRHILFNLDTPSCKQIHFGACVLLLESAFLALDELENRDEDGRSRALSKEIGVQFAKLVVHIGQLALTASLLSAKQLDNLPEVFRLYTKTIVLSVKAIVVAYIPSLVLRSMVVVFQDSYGSLKPRLTSELSHLPSVLLSLNPSLLRGLPPHLRNFLQTDIGIDMDQLGSVELRKTLIQGLVGGLSASLGLAVACGKTWIFGIFVLSFGPLLKALFGI